MGLDISKFIQKAEESLYGKNSRLKDENLNTNTEISVFKNIINQELTGAELDEAKSFAEQMGAELSKAQAPQKAPDKAHAKAPAGNINIDIDASTNVVINITVNQQIDNIVQSNIDGGQLDIDALVNALKELLTGDDTIKILESLVLSLFNQFADNFNLDLGELPKILEEILEKLKDTNEALNKNNEIINQLYQDMAAFIKRDMEILEIMGFNVQAIYEALKNIDTNGTNQLEMLSQIYDAIRDFQADMNNNAAIQQDQFNQIMEMLGQGNVKLDDITALLALIKADTEEGNKTSAQILEEVKNGNKEVLNIMNAFGQDIAAALIEIKKQIQENGNTNKDNFQKILNALNNLALLGGSGGDVTINVDLSVIEKLLEDIKNTTDEKLDAVTGLLEKIDQGVQDGNTLSKQILDAINKYGPDIAGTLNAILEKLEVVDQNVKEGNKLSQKILDAINQFGPEVTNILNNILAKLEENGDNFDSITHLLNAILDQAKANGEENNANFKAVLEAIANIPGGSGEAMDLTQITSLLGEILAAVTKQNSGGNVDLSVIEDLLQQILNKPDEKADLSEVINLLQQILTNNQENAEAVSVALQAILGNQDVIISLLEGFKVEISDFGGNFNTMLSDIDNLIDAIKQNFNNDHDCCDVNGAELMKVLLEILEAIQNHECNCNCNSATDDDGIHEGVIGDLNDVLKAPARPNTEGTEGLTTIMTEDGSQTGQKISMDINGVKQFVIKTPNGTIYNLSGVKVR